MRRRALRARPAPSGSVLGGHPVYCPGHTLPPFVVLTAPQAAEAAAYLSTVSFEALWQAGREDLSRPYPRPCDASAIRDHFAAHHAGLRAFYARAADEGHAVVKWLLV